MRSHCDDNHRDRTNYDGKKQWHADKKLEGMAREYCLNPNYEGACDGCDEMYDQYRTHPVLATLNRYGIWIIVLQLRLLRTCEANFDDVSKSQSREAYKVSRYFFGNLPPLRASLLGDFGNNIALSLRHYNSFIRVIRTIRGFILENDITFPSDRRRSVR